MICVLPNPSQYVSGITFAYLKSFQNLTSFTSKIHYYLDSHWRGTEQYSWRANQTLAFSERFANHEIYVLRRQDNITAVISYKKGMVLTKKYLFYRNIIEQMRIEK